jgi:hypothetical protein
VEQNIGFNETHGDRASRRGSVDRLPGSESRDVFTADLADRSAKIMNGGRLG